MAFADNLPVSESVAVFVGVTGFDWLAEGQAEPLKAVVAAVAAGAAIMLARHCLKNRHRE